MQSLKKDINLKNQQKTVIQIMVTMVLINSVTLNKDHLTQNYLER